MTSPRTLASILLEIDAMMDKLLDLSSRKTEVLTGGDVAALEGLLSVEQDLVQRLRLLEQERVACPAELLSGEEDISELRESLRDKAKRVSKANTRNQRLLRHGLEVIQREIRILFPQGNYGNPAILGPLVFDHRV